MNKKEYLNEEWYLKIKKRVRVIAIVILLIGLTIGGFLLFTGYSKQENAKRINNERKEAATLKVQNKVKKAKERLAAIKTEKESLQKQHDAKESQCDNIPMASPNWFADKNKCEREASAINSKITDLEQEEFKLENTKYTVYYDKVQPITYVPFYFIGGAVILFTCIIAGMVYLITIRREVAAFTAQQMMPVAQEGIEKISPSLGVAAGEISKGISQGMNQSNNTTPNTEQQEPEQEETL